MRYREEGGTIEVIRRFAATSLTDSVFQCPKSMFKEHVVWFLINQSMCRVWSGPATGSNQRTRRLAASCAALAAVRAVVMMIAMPLRTKRVYREAGSDVYLGGRKGSCRLNRQLLLTFPREGEISHRTSLGGAMKLKSVFCVGFYREIRLVTVMYMCLRGIK